MWRDTVALFVRSAEVDAALKNAVGAVLAQAGTGESAANEALTFDKAPSVTLGGTAHSEVQMQCQRQMVDVLIALIEASTTQPRWYVARDDVIALSHNPAMIGTAYTLAAVRTDAATYPTAYESTVVGDGVADDRSALIGDIAAAVTAKQPLSLPAASTIRITRVVPFISGLVIIGNGATIQGDWAEDESSLIGVGGCTGVFVHDVTFDGNSAIYTGMVASSAISDVTICNCTFTNFLRRPWRSSVYGRNLSFVYNTVSAIAGASGTVHGSSASFITNAVIAHNTYTGVGDDAGDWIFYSSGPPDESNAESGDFTLHCFGNVSDATCIGGIKVQYATPVSLPVRVYENTVYTASQATMVLDGVLDCAVHDNTHYPGGSGSVTGIAISNNGRQSNVTITDDTMEVAAGVAPADRYGIFVLTSEDTQVTIRGVTFTITGDGSGYWSAFVGAKQCALLDVDYCTADLSGASAAEFYAAYAGSSPQGVVIGDNNTY